MINYMEEILHIRITNVFKTLNYKLTFFPKSRSPQLNRCMNVFPIDFYILYPSKLGLKLLTVV